MKLKEYVEKTLNGEIMPSVEMGGLGDCYENAIQHLAFQMMCEFANYEEFDKEKIKAVQEKCVKLLDEQHGFSGAQVGAATNLSAIFWKKGVDVAIDEIKEIDPTRIICVKNCKVYNQENITP